MLHPHVFDKISGEFGGILHVFVNFAGFHGFTWISWLRDHAKYQKPWYHELRHLHYTNWQLKILHLVTVFLQLVAKRRLEEFFLISSPGYLLGSLVAPFGFTRHLPHTHLLQMGLTYHQYSPPNSSASSFLLPVSSCFVYLLVFLGADLPNGNEGRHKDS